MYPERLKICSTYEENKPFTLDDFGIIEKLKKGSDYPRTIAEITYKTSFDFILKPR